MNGSEIYLNLFELDWKEQNVNELIINELNQTENSPLHNGNKLFWNDRNWMAGKWTKLIRIRLHSNELSWN